MGGGLSRARQAALFFVGPFAAALLAAAVGGCSGPKPVASVNGQELTEKEFADLCETTTMQLQPGASVGSQVLAGWVSTALFAQLAKKTNVYPSEQDLQKRIAATEKDLQFRGTTLDKSLAERGVTLEAFKRQLLESMVQENLLYQGITVSDEDVKRAFDTRQDQFKLPESIKISQITVDSEKALKLAQADLAGGTQFPLVARSRSKDPFQPGSGQVPMELTHNTPAGGPVAPEVVEAAFKLKPGQVSEPIKVGATWVIARLEEKNAEKRPTFEDVKELIRSGVRGQKAQSNPAAQQQVQKTISESFKSADVKVFRPELQMVETQFKQRQLAVSGAPAGSPMVQVPGGQ